MRSVESAWQANEKLKAFWIPFCHLHMRSQKLVLSMFTLMLFTHSLERNTEVSFAYERSSTMKIDLMFSSFNWITAGEMIF